MFISVLMVDFQGVGLLNWKGNLRNVTADLSKPIQFAEKEQYLKHSITLIKKGENILLSTELESGFT